MKDNVSIIFAIIFAVLLLVILPLVSVLDRQDSMAYNVALKLTTEFVDSVRNKGFIDRDSYNAYITKLGTTGVLYDIKMEAYKKKAIISEDKTNEEEENVEYKKVGFVDNNIDILNKINDNTKEKDENSNETKNVYLLSVEDEFYISIYNKSVSSASLIYRFISGTTDTRIIDIKYGGVINKIDWKLYEQAMDVNSLNPKIQMGIPKNTSKKTPIISYYETNLAEDIDANKRLNYEYLFDITDYTDIIDQEKNRITTYNKDKTDENKIKVDNYDYMYSYGKDNTSTQNNSLTLAVKLEDNSKLNTTGDEISFIKSKVSVEGINSKISIILPNATNGYSDYYDFYVKLEDINLAILSDSMITTNITFEEGLSVRTLTDGTQVYSDRTESVPFTIVDQRGVHNVKISLPYIYNLGIEDGQLPDGVVYANVDTAFQITYNRIKNEDIDTIKEKILANIEIVGPEYDELEIVNAKAYEGGSGIVTVKFKYNKIPAGDIHENCELKLIEEWTVLEDDSPALGAKSTPYTVVQETTIPSIPKIILSEIPEESDGNYWYNDEKIYVIIEDANDTQSKIGKYEYDLIDLSTGSKNTYTIKPGEKGVIQTPNDVSKKLKIVVRAYDNTYDNIGSNEPSSSEITIYIDRQLPTKGNSKIYAKLNVWNEYKIDAKESIKINNGEDFDQNIMGVSAYVNSQINNQDDILETLDTNIKALKTKDGKVWLPSGNMLWRFFNGYKLYFEVDEEGIGLNMEYYIKAKSGEETQSNLNLQSGFKKAIVSIENNEGAITERNIYQPASEITINKISSTYFENKVLKKYDALSNGKNTVTVLTYDKAGNVSKNVRDVYIDRNIPIVQMFCGESTPCVDMNPIDKEVRYDSDARNEILNLPSLPTIYTGDHLDITSTISEPLNESGIIEATFEVKEYDTNDDSAGGEYLKYKIKLYSKTIRAEDDKPFFKETFKYSLDGTTNKTERRILVSVSCIDAAYNVHIYEKEIVYDPTRAFEVEVAEGTKGNNGWYIGPVKIKAKGKDEIFSKVSYKWMLDGVVLNEGTSSTTIPSYTTNKDTDTSKKLYDIYICRITQQVTEDGVTKNVIKSGSIDLKIDKTPPTAGTLIMKHENASGADYSSGSWTKDNIYIKKTDGYDTKNAEGKNTGSGHASTKIKLNGSEISSTDGTYTITQSGTYTVSVVTEDIAGNKAESATQTVKIDKDAPSIYFKNYDPVLKRDKIEIKIITMDKEFGTGTKEVRVAWTDKLGTKQERTVELNKYSEKKYDALFAKYKDADGVFEVTENGTYTFTVVDNVGNEHQEQITVDKIK